LPARTDVEAMAECAKLGSTSIPWAALAGTPNIQPDIPITASP